MKKLMIATVAVALATTVQAASYIWGVAGGEYTAADGTNPMDYGTAFLYYGTVSASDSAFDFGTASLITSAGYNADQGIYGNLDDSALDASDAFSSTDAGQKFTIILVDKGVNSLDNYEGNYFLVVGDSERGEIPGATTAYYATFANYDAVTQSDWKTMGAVPEPTSGLLMLLGMAGLALRRRRA